MSGLQEGVRAARDNGTGERPVYLIGFMGSGKSTVSRILAGMLGVKHLEMDEVIEREAGRSVSEIFAEEGEEAFREKESALVRRIADGGAAGVSCGGGTVLRPENVSLMRGSGTVVLLSAAPETIYRRVGHSRTRPVLEGHRSVEGVRELMAGREEAYRRAAEFTVTVDDKTPEEIAEEIATLLSGNE